MKKEYSSYGFRDVIDEVNISTGKGLQHGDVLVSTTHTAIYKNGNKIVHASTSKASPENQVLEEDYKNKNWNSVLRYMK